MVKRDVERSALNTCFVGKTIHYLDNLWQNIHHMLHQPLIPLKQSQHALKERTFETKTEHIHTFVWTMHIICVSLRLVPVF